MRASQVVRGERCNCSGVLTRRRFLLGAIVTRGLGIVRLACAARLVAACGLLLALSAAEAQDSAKQDGSALIEARATIPVNVNGDNDAGANTTAAGLMAVEGGLFTHEFGCVWDPPQERGICVWANPGDLPPGADLPMVSGSNFVTSTMTWTPTFCQSGPYTLVWRCGEVCFSELEHGSYDLTVNNVNRPPTITTVPSTSIAVTEGTPVHIDVTGIDPDTTQCNDPLNEDILTLEKVSGPGDFVDHGCGKGTSEWIADVPGDTTLRFRVDDAHAATCTATVEIKVGPSPECGNNIRRGDEQCDGTDDAACRGQCRKNCTCLLSPTQQEVKDFEAKLDRIRARAPGIFPEAVTLAINSLTGVQGLPGSVQISFGCPAGAQVNITISTHHRKWDGEFVKTKAGPKGEGAVGAYFWCIPPPVVAGGKKSYTATNVIMLDPAVTTKQEQDGPAGQLSDETLLYHELLHGQLLINAMLTEEWQKNVCKCGKTDLAPADNEKHAIIWGLEETYMQRVAPTVANVYLVRPAQPIANQAGYFEIPIGREVDLLWNKSKLNWKCYFTSQSNVHQSEGDNACDPNDPDAVGVVVENGRVLVRGKLTVAAMCGYFLVHIDPPTSWVFTGIETGIVILPASTVPIPTVSEWGLVALTLLLLTVATIMLGRRRPGGRARIALSHKG